MQIPDLLMAAYQLTEYEFAVTIFRIKRASYK